MSLQAVLAAMESLRYTPAGIPVVDVMLAHRSVQREGGHARQVQFEVAARFAAAVAERLVRTPLGSLLQVRGFLAPRRQGSKTLLLHVTEFNAVPPSQAS